MFLKRRQPFCSFEASGGREVAVEGLDGAAVGVGWGDGGGGVIVVD